MEQKTLKVKISTVTDDKLVILLFYTHLLHISRLLADLQGELQGKLKSKYVKQGKNMFGFNVTTIDVDNLSSVTDYVSMVTSNVGELRQLPTEVKV